MIKKFMAFLVITAFFFTCIGPLPQASAQDTFAEPILGSEGELRLPAPGILVNKSAPYQPLQLKGILINAKDPLRFDFLVDKGNSGLQGQPLKDDITRLAKYFLTCLAVPENDLWVNLSPYEKDRIVPSNFGTTLMGKDLLEQDYLLKQIMASLSYPENNLGKLFWQKVYQKSYELYGTTQIPVSTFNKVWILPKSAQVYVQGNGAFVVDSQLDVMLEADYKALAHHQGASQGPGAFSQVLRDVIIPQLRQEVNTGKNFALVRQVYNAMILATWYKRHLENSLLGRMYVGKNEVNGVDIADKNAKEKIFQQYLAAYKKCVYNYIKEDYDPATGQSQPRKYVSGGMYFAGFGASGSVYTERSSLPQGMSIGTDLAMATVNVTAHTQSLSISKYLRSLILPIAFAVAGFLIPSVSMGQAIGDTSRSVVATLVDSTQTSLTDTTQANQHGMDISAVIEQTINNTDSVVNLESNLQDAQQKMSDAPEKGTVRLYVEGGNEDNPVLRYIGLGLECRTPALTHPTKTHDKRQKPIDDAFSDVSKNIRIRGNVYEMITKVKKYASISDNLKRLESTGIAGLEDEIARAKEDQRHQLALITSSLDIPLKDLPADSTITITNAWMDMEHVAALAKQKGVQGQTQAAVAGLTAQGKVEGVRGNWEVKQRSFLKKITPSHLTVHITPTIGTLGKGLVGWLLGFVTPEWKTFPKFDAQAQAGVIKDASAIWMDARLNAYRQLKQTFLDLRKYQIQKIAADAVWKNRGSESDPEKLGEMSTKILELEEKITASQLTAMNMGVEEDLLENVNLQTEDSLIKFAQDFVEIGFNQGVQDMKTQIVEWQEQLKVHHRHKDRKKVPIILAALDSITNSMQAPLKDEDIQLPAADATGGVSAAAAGFKLTPTGLVNPIASYTNGTSSNSSEAPTFIKGFNYGNTGRIIFHTANKKTKDLQSQMNFAQDQYASAQQSGSGGGDGPPEFRRSIYGYLTASLAEKVVSGRQGLDFTAMLASYRTTDLHDNYTVISPEVIDPVHWIVKGAKALFHSKQKEQASVITAQALIEEFKLTAKQEMFEAWADTAKGPRWQAWDNFLKGQSPFIIKTDPKGKVAAEFDAILENLRQEFRPLWASGPPPPPDEEPLDLRIMKLHLATAKRLLSYGPDKVAYWTAPVLVRVGTNGGPQYWWGLRGGATINFADKKRAASDVKLQIDQLEDLVNRRETAWQNEQADQKAKASTGQAMGKILLNQTEEGPLIVKAAQTRWLEIAQAVSAQQPINRQWARINSQGKEPRTIALNMLGSLQLNPTLSEQILGGLNKDLFDWLRHARIGEVKAWITKIQYQKKVDGITAARHVTELLKQQEFALNEFQKADTLLKANLANGQVLESYKNKYLRARTQLESASNEIIVALSVMDEQQQRTLGIERIRLQTAPIPKPDQFVQNNADTTTFLSSLNGGESNMLFPSPLRGGPGRGASKIPTPLWVTNSSSSTDTAGNSQPTSQTANISPSDSTQASLAAAQQYSTNPTAVAGNQPSHVVQSPNAVEKANFIDFQSISKHWPLYVGFAVLGIGGITALAIVAKRKRSKEQALVDSAMSSKGGIDMNSRLMKLNISGDDQNRFKFDGGIMPEIIINGVVPQVLEVTTVTPQMLNSILGLS